HSQQNNSAPLWRQQDAVLTAHTYLHPCVFRKWAMINRVDGLQRQVTCSYEITCQLALIVDCVHACVEHGVLRRFTMAAGQQQPLRADDQAHWLTFLPVLILTG